MHLLPLICMPKLYPKSKFTFVLFSIPKYIHIAIDCELKFLIRTVLDYIKIKVFF